MIVPYRDSLLRLFALPTIKDQFKCSLSKQELFSRLHTLKKNHGNLVSRILIDDANGKFWIDSGSYAPTTFRGILVKNDERNFVDVSFNKGPALVSFFLLIFSGLAWVLFLLTRHDAELIFKCFFFISIIHIFNTFIFYSNVSDTIKFLVDELEVYPDFGSDEPLVRKKLSSADTDGDLPLEVQTQKSPPARRPEGR